jgi:glycosyltransferase involved in cell wall biosynthesis
VGGIPDVVQEGHTGYTFPIGDVDGLIAGVQEIVRDPAKLTQMGRAARAYAETQTWDHMMDEVIEIYERLIFEKNQIRATA